MSMRENLNEILRDALERMEHIASADELEAQRVRFLGKKGSLTAALRSMGQLAPEERPAFGQMVNDVRKKIETLFDQKEQRFRQKEKEIRLEEEKLDVTMPGKPVSVGHLHPLSIVQRQVEDIFIGLGFQIAEGPEIEQDYYNFELLNLPKNHPARDMQDTLYFSDNLLLRTHTSPVQARTMLKQQPPIRIICPGRVYRADEVDASHSPVFHQCEGLAVDEKITMSDLRGALAVFARELFGEKTRIRFRPSFFPFTEPSAEVDASCSVCGGGGCRTCKGTGWIEILGCGMVNPKVLRMCGIDPEKYSGYAFGMGLDRIAMIRYGITDMRVLFENDVRFIGQF